MYKSTFKGQLQDEWIDVQIWYRIRSPQKMGIIQGFQSRDLKYLRYYYVFQQFIRFLLVCPPVVIGCDHFGLEYCFRPDRIDGERWCQLRFYNEYMILFSVIFDTVSVSRGAWRVEERTDSAGPAKGRPTRSLMRAIANVPSSPEKLTSIHQKKERLRRSVPTDLSKRSVPVRVLQLIKILRVCSPTRS